MRLRVADQIFSSFETIRITQRYDSLASTMEFDGAFNPGNNFHRRIFRPYNYEQYEVLYNRNGRDVVIQTGTLLNRSSTLSSKEHLTTVSGYSKSGVIQDCTVPLDFYPLQFDRLNLIEISQELLFPYQIGLSVDEGVLGDAQIPFEVTEIGDTQKIGDYLRILCQQRNIVLTHDAGGNILFTRARTQAEPVQHFENNVGAIKIGLTTNGQNSFQTTQVFGTSDLDNDNAVQATINNPFVNANRVTSVNMTSGSDEGIANSAINAVSQEFKNTRLQVSMDRITFQNGALVEPNNIITVRSPELFLFNRTKFFVESVNIEIQAEQETAILTCVLPNAYDGTQPENIFNV